MSNPLTGDFEAVLQVSGATVNRLLASMHQDTAANKKTPSFPHGVWIRIGDPTPVGGMRGNALAQISVPRIELVHGVSDRFWLEVSIRARYTADPGTVPIPEYIHGTIRAQYKIDKIDPSCRGWEKLAPDYIWVRAISDTVSFTGTAEDDVNFMSVVQTGVDPATADARITRLAKYLLTRQFEATPHKVSRRFRGGSMRSLNVGMNRSAVAVPIGLSGDPVSGNIASINQDFLDASDVGIAIDKNYIVGKIQAELDALKASFQRQFQVYHRTYLDLGLLGDLDVLEVTIDYTAKLTSASVQWIGGVPPMAGISVPGGLVSITIAGSVLTQKKIFNFGFSATQLLMISFNPATESFSVSAVGKPTVSLSGVLESFIEAKAKPVLEKEIPDAVKNAAAGMAGELSLATRKKDLIDQLQTMDGLANVWFDQAVFSADGVVVRGHISVSGRRPPVHSFAVNGQKDGYSGFESWIPGGRVDSFGWSWKWFNNAGSPGSQKTTDRFLLRRPIATGQGKFGVVIGQRESLPGIDGMGQMCLVVDGVHVHPVTGALVPVSTARKCKRFGLDIRLAIPGRVFLIEWVPGPRDLIGPVAEVAVHEVGGRNTRGHGANTLVVRVGDRWNREVAMSLREGLANSRRRDAGLVVLMLFNDGTLMRSGEWFNEVNELAAELEAPLVVNEDVRGSWAQAFRMGGEDGTVRDVEWRLLSPTGGVTWAKSGQLEGEELALALDDYLFRSPVPNPAPVRGGLSAGSRISAGIFGIDLIGQLDDIEATCPPLPFGRLGVDAQVTFVTKGSKASDAALRKLTSEGRGDGDEGVQAIVFDGATSEEIDELQQSLPEGFMAIADPEGTISKRFRVRVWPARVAINGNGIVTGFDSGIEPESATDPVHSDERETS